MSEQVVNTAAPAAAAPESSGQVAESTENTELEGLEAEEGEESNEASASEESKDSKSPKKEDKKTKEIEKRLKKLKLKVDNKEYEEEIDLDDEENLVRQLQLAKMGQKRAQEKAELEKEVSQFFKALQDDPISLLSKDFGMDMNKLIEDYINREIENSKKTPEQVEKERLENELKAIKAERDREKQEAQSRELERLQQVEFEKLDNQLTSALEKSQLPNSPYFVKKVADYMAVALEAGHDVSADDVIPLVKEELESDLSQLLQVMPEEAVEKLLGDQVLNKLRKRRIAKAKEAQAAVTKPKIEDSGKNSNSEKPKSKDKVSFKQFFGV